MITEVLKRLIAIVLLGSIVLGCGRETITPNLERPERAESEEDLLKDGVYRDTYGLYLWQEDLPDWFADVRGNTRRFNSADAVLEALKGHTRTAAGDTLDRFSFLDRWGTVNAEIQLGLAGSFGFDMRYDNDTDLYVKKVDLGSPAFDAGLRRGWQILQINGNSDLAVATTEKDNFRTLFTALDGATISLQLRKPDGDLVSVRLDRKNYQLQPISARQVYAIDGKKVGYFAFDVFVSTLNDRGNPTYVKTQLDQLIAQFAEHGIRELIVDLRYNGGGAVVTAEYLSNVLAPVSVGNSLMYTNKVNENLSAFLNARRVQADFSPVHFSGAKPLSLDRIYMLVTESTASASELLINILKPHIDVKLIGEHATYGKPVGYFAWNVRGVDLYAVSFQTFNSEGFGDYFSGMPVDKVAYDDLTKDFGDPAEALIAEALHYARTGSFLPNSLPLQSRVPARTVNTGSAYSNRELDSRLNKGMYIFGKK